MSTKGIHRKDLSEYHWTNGLPPTEDESPQWLQHRETKGRLAARSGRELNETTIELSLDELKEMPKQQYIAVHSCMQGWTATSKWAGVKLQDVLALLGPRPNMPTMCSSNPRTGTSHVR